ncbi:hypothetical protein ACFSTE_11190 [Aquimarina hainanensis]|uniref:Uncharacterized protein n=1 Tax=Aquimarina hainanensis TaxID=1578017 RepID=A0ABW5NAE5_9FLAO
MTTTEVMDKIQLVDNTFTPSEASDVVNALIKEKINFHKLHRLSMHEGNQHIDSSYDDERIAQLLKEKEAFKAVFKEAMTTGKRVEINGTLTIKITD